MLEERQHGAVVRQHLGEEPLDPDRGGSLRELLEQARADPAPLIGVRNGERGLGDGRIAKAHVVRDGDDASLVVGARERAEQRPRSTQSGSSRDSTSCGRRFGKPWKRMPRLSRETPEERQEGLGVRGGRRPQPRGSPVSENDVDGIGCDAHGCIFAAAGAGRTSRPAPAAGSKLGAASRLCFGSRPTGSAAGRPSARSCAPRPAKTS